MSGSPYMYVNFLALTVMDGGVYYKQLFCFYLLTLAVILALMCVSAWRACSQLLAFTISKRSFDSICSSIWNRQ
jgi:hypothetical protein